MAHVRVLARSLEAHHPDAALTVLVIDDIEGSVDPDAPNLRVVTPSAVFSDMREFHRMAGIYTLIELATAVKPTLLEHLLQESSEILYLDPDILILSSIADLTPQIREHSIILTPHYTEPPAGEGHIEWEFQTMIRGAFNCGFIAVSDQAKDFVNWWKERVARHCFYAPDAGYFVDQAWVDLVPSYFDHEVLRDPGWNVAPWNTSTRTVSYSDDRYTVNGVPLRFFHFSAFEPERPYLLSRWLLPEPRTPLSENPSLARLCAEYADALFASGYEKIAQEPYALEQLPDGSPLNWRMRQIYHESLIEAEANGAVEPPNPFEDTAAFLNWLTEPPSREHSAAGLSRYCYALWKSRPELRHQFPEPLGADASDFRAWIDEEGVSSVEPPAELLRAPQRPTTGSSPPDEHDLRPGVDLVYADPRDDAYALAASRLVEAVRLEGLPLSITELQIDDHTNTADHNFDQSVFCHDTLVLCLSPERISTFAYALPARFFARRRTVAVWPDQSVDGTHAQAVAHLVDEVWAASDEMVADMERSIDSGVELLPAGAIGSPLASSGNAARAEGRLRFLWLEEGRIPYDPSHALRAIGAYSEAFSPEMGHSLLVGVATDRPRRVEFEQLRLAAERADVDTSIRSFSNADLQDLMTSADCFVCLGPGAAANRFLVEVMAQGKPVVATAPPIDRRLVGDQTGYWLPAGQDEASDHITEPAALVTEFLKRIAASPEEASEIGRHARDQALRFHSTAALRTFVSTRIRDILVSPVVAEPAPSSSSTTESATGLERAIQYLQTGPRNPWDSPSRMGRLGLLLRRASLRFMRPYTVRHQELDDAIVESLAELHRHHEHTERRLAALERGSQDSAQRGS